MGDQNPSWSELVGAGRLAGQLPEVEHGTSEIINTHAEGSINFIGPKAENGENGENGRSSFVDLGVFDGLWRCDKTVGCLIS